MSELKKIEIAEESEVWLTSDTHFSHKNIAGPEISSWKDGYRNFKSTEEMDDLLIKTINKYVKKEDVLFHIGDFAFGDKKKIPSHRHALQVQTIHLIKGNHDGAIDRYKSNFTSVQDYLEGNVKGVNLIMFHYSMRVWAGSHKGFYHAYGHSHASLEHTPWGKSMDVGVDNAYKLFGEYRPFKLSEFVNILKKREIEFCDHHDSQTNIR